jgi:hypothetical protein
MNLNIKKIFFSFIFLLVLFCISGIGKEKISKKNIKIGEQINLTIILKDLKDVNILWEDMNSTYSTVETISKKNYFKNKNLYIEITFTFFESGEYNGFSYTIPISQPNGEMLYLYSEKYNIKVENTLTKEELDTIKNIKDTTSIKLKKEKDQAHFPFYFSFYFKIFLIIIVILIIALVLYYFIYNYIMKKNQKEKYDNIPPYQMFLVKLEKILFTKNDDRKVIEKKLSELTEIFKELIHNELSSNAPSETTKELMISLRKINLDSNITKEINQLLNEIDMVKFAKAPVEYNRLLLYLKSIKNFGNEIHNYKKSLEPIENKN